MPLHSVESRSRVSRHDFERSPKISIVTDAADIQSIPREIRALARDERRIIRDFEQWSRSEGDSNACLVWLSGDRLIEGKTSDLQKLLHSPDRRSFVVVDTRGAGGIPYLTIQPRMFVKPATVDYKSFHIRVESGTASVVRFMADSSRPEGPWAGLADAISAESTRPGSGIDRLVQLFESREKLPDVISALVTRNLVVAMLQHHKTENACAFLQSGFESHPTYAELHFLAALLAFRESRFREVVPLLERAKSCGITFPGSGGENSYRCDWLLGVMAAKVGDDRVAFRHFLPGVKHDPPFEPSLTELLKLQLPPQLVEIHQHVLTRAARFNPNVATSVTECLVRHGLLDAARLVARTAPLPSAERESTANQLALSAAPRRSVSKQPVGVAFEGPFFEYSSLARVNREIARALQASGEFELRVQTSSPAALPSCAIEHGAALTPSVHKRLNQTDLTIRHQWPPNLRRPPTGKLAVILPWEYGGVPKVWVEKIQRNVDELWVPSNFVRGVFVRNGVDAERVKTIPNGYDPDVFRTDGPKFHPPGSRDFRFLFVGGAIRRKGIDLLLQAYDAAFSMNVNVTLVLLISGSTGAYQQNSWAAEIRAASKSPNFPHVLSIFDAIDDATLSSLYRGCDAFVLPYRGEGFGMPLLEAMACGKPVITTAEGPSKDFCDDSNSYLIPATTEMVTDTTPPLGPIIGDFTWFEPNFTELVRALRNVHQNASEAAARGQVAANSVRRLTWRDVTSQYAARIRVLSRR